MRSANFVSFFTVQGFFFGIVFALFQANSAEDLLAYTFLVTIFFYLFSHVAVSFYLRTVNVTGHFFYKNAYERDLDILVREINKRESEIDQQTDILEENVFMEAAARRTHSE